eukprot:TRINITY_DN20473_c0_g1_i1.p1 TRINITY_DN20473_c0_g1~~TRINITY_DN20473_c0_g1_i1.p1  ORF type:complete len:729 (-),score=139.56 TRINITY_DN20473_c0_g1_i1:201-2201(-)
MEYTSRSRSATSVISKDAIANEVVDPGSVVATRRQRTIVYFILCQAVQMFMSYDTGATAASIDTIKSGRPVGYWTNGDLSLLGAMDKIGTTAFSLVWGRLLQLLPTKLLLVFALLLNACCTLLFGLLTDKYAMFAMKFAMGATQALQNIWGTVWTVTMAPPDCVTLWMALGGVSAGAGTAIGSAMAGFGTANGLPYSFAFTLQASMLFLFWLFQAWTPAPRLAMTLPPEAPCDCGSGNSPAAAAAGEDAKSGVEASRKLGMRQQLRALWRNKVYVWTIVATCLNQFQCNAVQFFFILIFGEAWGLNKNFTTTMLLVVPGIGMVAGVVFGPPYIDRKGGFSTKAGMLRTIKIMQNLCILVGLASMIGMGFLYGKLRAEDRLSLGQYGDVWLYGVWFAIALTSFGHSSCVAALAGINTECVQPEMRAFASGLETCLRNMLGLFAGTLVPGFFMDAAADFYGWDLSQSEDGDRLWQEKTYVYCLGMGVIFFAGFFAYPAMGNASKHAALDLAGAQHSAMERLRTALMHEDVEELNAAVVEAKCVELSLTKHGEAVVGMANQVIGERRLGRRKSATSVAAKDGIDLEKASRETLVLRIQSLEATLARSNLLQDDPKLSPPSTAASTFAAATPCSAMATQTDVTVPPSPEWCLEARLLRPVCTPPPKRISV